MIDRRAVKCQLAREPKVIQNLEREMDTVVFENFESNVRTYCRAFPKVFRKAKGAYLEDEDGRRYIDFFAGAGALNYGHNPDFIKAELIEYMINDGVTHCLDMYTHAKRQFLNSFAEIILKPRHLDYKVQFCGPTGANSVEAPTDTPYGDRRGMVEDKWGNTWQIATYNPR